MKFNPSGTLFIYIFVVCMCVFNFWTVHSNEKQSFLEVVFLGEVLGLVASHHKDFCLKQSIDGIMKNMVKILMSKLDSNW